MICREHHSLGWLHFCWQSVKYAVSGSPILQDEEQSNPPALLHPTLVFSRVWRWVPKHPFSATAGGRVDRGCLKFFQRWECFTGNRKDAEGCQTRVLLLQHQDFKKYPQKSIASTCNILVGWGFFCSSGLLTVFNNDVNSICFHYSMCTVLLGDKWPLPG